MKPALFFLMFCAVFLVLGSSAPGQLSPWENQGWGSEEPYGMLYDPTTQMSISGRIVRIEEVQPGRASGPAVFIHIETNEGTFVPVLLGPRWYVLSQRVSLSVADRARVAGSRVILSGTAVIIAAWVQSGNQFLLLRDDYGFPVWSQW